MVRRTLTSREIGYIDAYQELLKKRPELFTESDEYKIISDRKEMIEFVQYSHTPIGVIYASQWNQMVVDLVEDPEGGRFPYERVIATNPGKPIVMVTMYQGKLLLLDQYRHAIRAPQFSFPRIYGSDSDLDVENAAKELVNELGCKLKRFKILGEIAADSGVTATKTTAILCDVEGFKATGIQGIRGVMRLSAGQLEKMIADGLIDDGFTLSSFMLCKAKKIF